MHTPRPLDDHAVKTALRTVKRRSRVPVVMAGDYDRGLLNLRHFIGVRSDRLRGLEVRRGTGLGGHVVATSQPAAVTDYARSTGITSHYRDAVRDEGLRSMVAVPVLVANSPRLVLYGALRTSGSIGDHVTRDFRSTAAALGTELRIRDEVERRLAESECARAELRFGLDPADRERLRTLQGELRAMAATVTDSPLRTRLVEAGNMLADVGRGTREDASPPPLTPREVDVLPQVALGCSNAEVGSRLALAPETIKAYLRNIGVKLGTSTRAESVARARLLGLLL